MTVSGALGTEGSRGLQARHLEATHGPVALPALTAGARMPQVHQIEGPGTPGKDLPHRQQFVLMESRNTVLTKTTSLRKCPKFFTNVTTKSKLFYLVSC